MAIRRKFVELKERVETKYIYYIDQNGEEVKILDSEKDKIPAGCRISRWAREQEIVVYRMPVEKFLLHTVCED